MVQDYYAFISYSRKDIKAAKYLQKGFENYSYKKHKVADEYKPKDPDYLRKIFRDKTDLSYKEHDYRKGLRLALDNSRYLVVLCSPNSKDSVEVRHEIEDFLATPGHTEKDIIPVILSGHPGKEDDPIPDILRTDEFMLRNLPMMMPEENETERDAWEAGLIGPLPP